MKKDFIYTIKNVTLEYRKNAPVVHNINIEIEEGDFVSLIGPNGSGKSTLLRSLAKILKNKTGTIAHHDKLIYSNHLDKIIHLGTYFFRLPIEQYHFNKSLKKITKYDQTQYQKDKQIVYKNYHLSKVWLWAKNLGIKPGTIIASKINHQYHPNFLAVMQYCYCHNLKFATHMLYKDFILSPQMKAHPEFYAFLQKLSCPDNQLVYCPHFDWQLYLFNKYLTKKKITIDQDIVFTETNPFYLSETNNIYLNHKLYQLQKIYQLLGVKDNQICYTFQKQYYSPKEYAKHVAFVPQITNFAPDITVYEFVAMGRFPHQNSTFKKCYPTDDDYIIQALKDVNLYDKKDVDMSELSGGQLQRAAIAVALAQNTCTILLDEPTNHLDLKHQLEIMELLSVLNKQKNKTIILVVHDINQAIRYSNKIAIMHHGELKRYGLVNDVIDEDVIKEIFGVNTQINFENNKKIFTNYWIGNKNENN